MHTNPLQTLSHIGSRVLKDTATPVTTFGTANQLSTHPTLPPNTFPVQGGEPLAGELDVLLFEVEAEEGSAQLLCS